MCEMNRSDIACCRCSNPTIFSLLTRRIALEVIAVADQDLARARNVASQFNARHATNSALDAIRAHKVDAAFVATGRGAS